MFGYNLIALLEVINQTGYNASADIWSLGITIIEISEGRPPHSSMHPMKALFAIPRYPSPKLSKKFSKTLRDFVELCLNKSPELVRIRSLRFLSKSNESAATYREGTVETQGR